MITTNIKESLKTAAAETLSGADDGLSSLAEQATADAVWEFSQSHPDGFTLDIRTMTEPTEGIAVSYAPCSTTAMWAAGLTQRTAFTILTVPNCFLRTSWRKRSSSVRRMARLLSTSCQPVQTFISTTINLRSQVSNFSYLRFFWNSWRARRICSRKRSLVCIRA